MLRSSIFSINKNKQIESTILGDHSNKWSKCTYIDLSLSLSYFHSSFVCHFVARVRVEQT